MLLLFNTLSRLLLQPLLGQMCLCLSCCRVSGLPTYQVLIEQMTLKDFRKRISARQVRKSCWKWRDMEPFVVRS